MNRLTKAPTVLLAASVLGIVLTGCAAEAGQTADTSVASQQAASAAAPSAPAPDSGSDGTTTQPATSAPPVAAPTDPAAQAATTGNWIDQATYEANPQKYHDAGNVVLFFNASWCPTCREAVSNLDADGVPAGLTVVSVDYDSASQLKREYGVTVQHTFVQVDPSGAQQTKFTGAVSGEQIASKTV